MTAVQTDPFPIRRWLLAWLGMLPLAILNGAARDLIYRDLLGVSLAQQVSSLSAALLFGIYIYWAMRWLQPETARRALIGGLFWLSLTVSFEFLFGHFLADQPWDALWANYRIWDGRLWPLLLLWIAIAPLLLGRRQKRSPPNLAASRATAGARR